MSSVHPHTHTHTHPHPHPHSHSHSHSHSHAYSSLSRGGTPILAPHQPHHKSELTPLLASKSPALRSRLPIANAATKDAFTLNETRPTETSPLISAASQPDEVITDGSISSLLSLAWPLVLSMLLQNGNILIILVFTGHLKDEAGEDNPVFLAGAALGNCFATVSAYSVVFGILTPIDSMSSAAYGAAQTPGLDAETRRAYLQQVGLVVQKMGAIVALILIPILALWLNAGRVLRFVGQDAAASGMAQIYLLCLAPDLLFQVCNQMLDTYLTVQQVTKPIFIISIITFPVQILFSWLLSSYFLLGFTAAPLAQACTSSSMLIIRIILIAYLGVFERTWPPLSRAIFRGWGPILKLGLPGLVMISLNWWSLELAAIPAGWLGTVQLSAWVSIVAIFTACYMLAVGLHNAGMVLIGNNLGADQPAMAKQAAKSTLTVALAFAIVQAILLNTFQSSIGYAFSSDPIVVAYISTLIPYLSVQLFFETIQCVLSAILQAMGKQNVGAIVNFIGYYCVGLPIGVTLLYGFGWEIAGMLSGLTLGSVVNCIIFASKLAAIDWQQEAINAKERLEEEEAEQFKAEIDALETL